MDSNDSLSEKHVSVFASVQFANTTTCPRHIAIKMINIVMRQALIHTLAKHNTQMRENSVATHMHMHLALCTRTRVFFNTPSMSMSLRRANGINKRPDALGQRAQLERYSTHTVASYRGKFDTAIYRGKFAQHYANYARCALDDRIERTNTRAALRPTHTTLSRKTSRRSSRKTCIAVAE